MDSWLLAGVLYLRAGIELGVIHFALAGTRPCGTPTRINPTCIIGIGTGDPA